MRVAHIVNPVGKVAPSSDLAFAQPVTLETMRLARDHAAETVKVRLFTAQFPEDHGIIPEDFHKTPDLKRSVLDIGKFARPRKYPFFRDVLDRLCEAAPDADYMIYTNMDIALQPSFYTAVAWYVRNGHDSFAINRRVISREHTRLEDLPFMFGQIGEPHGGHDCYVWRREIYPKFRLENIIIGAIGIGKAAILNQLVHARNWTEFKDLHLTFHLGADRDTATHERGEFTVFNLGELRKITQSYRDDGSLPDHPIVTRFTKNLGV